jgi:putative oxidoreductase
MNRVTDPWASLGLLVLRLGTAFLLFYGHGWQKLVGFGERIHTFSNPIGLGPEVSFILVVIAEVVCSTLIAIGLRTQLAALPIIGFTLVATFIHHAADPWPRKELALLFLFPALTLVFTGPGLFSIDAMFGRRKSG